MARFNQATFSSLSLTKDDEKKFTEWVTKHTPKPMEAMQELLGQGYKVSITWVTDSNSFCLSLIGTDESRVNKGVIMTSWSDDLEEVILIAAYKHVVVCDGGEWPVRVSGERWG